MRNYRDLTDEELAELERLYPVTTNRELSRQFDVSIDAIRDSLARPRGWKKDRKAVLIGNRNGKTLTEDEVKWVVQHYKHTKNEDILRKFGVGECQLHRLARRYGLKKSRQFLKKVRSENYVISEIVRQEYGLDSQRAENARRQWAERKASGLPHNVGFKKGESNKTRFGEERFAEMIAKARASRNETIRKDKMRIRWGLPQKSKLKLVSGGSKRSSYKYLFKKRNYIVEYGSTDIYYDEQTDRSATMEANAHKYGLTVMAAAED